jgi:hypothetical protein
LNVLFVSPGPVFRDIGPLLLARQIQPTGGKAPQPWWRQQASFKVPDNIPYALESPR